MSDPCPSLVVCERRSGRATIYRNLGDQRGQAEALNETGTLHQISGDLAKAQAHHQQALELARALGSVACWDEAPSTCGRSDFTATKHA